MPFLVHYGALNIGAGSDVCFLKKTHGKEENPEGERQVKSYLEKAWKLYDLETK